MKILTDWGKGREEELEGSFGERVFLAENAEVNPDLSAEVRKLELFEEIKELADVIREGGSEANDI